MSCFLSSIGKLWADGGLRDLLVDSGVYDGNTAELMLVGKEFNRGVRGFTLVLKPYKFCLSRHSYTGVGLAAIM